MNKQLLYTCICAFLITSIIACKSNSTQDKIVGTWIPVNTGGANGMDIKIKFLQNKVGVAERKGLKPSSSDSITYEIKNNGKLLVTTERSGKVEEIEIIKLDDKELLMHSKNAGDTFRLIREK